MDVAKLLRKERDSHVSAGLYHWTQIEFSYNSNHIEGSTITENQTAQIFHTDSFIADSNQKIREDDFKETKNHFKLLDYILDTVDHPLNLRYIKKLQGILKKGTSDEVNPGKAVGDFKIRNNVIGHLLGNTPTSEVGDVANDLQALVDRWEKSNNRSLEDYAKFHYEFETIHPFSDGNGRIGRILLFKERCRVKQMPFIIRDENKAYYYRGLSQFNSDPAYSVDTLGQALDEYTMAFNQVYGHDLHKDQKKKKHHER